MIKEKALKTKLSSRLSVNITQQVLLASLKRSLAKLANLANPPDSADLADWLDFLQDLRKQTTLGRK